MEWARGCVQKMFSSWISNETINNSRGLNQDLHKLLPSWTWCFKTVSLPIPRSHRQYVPIIELFVWNPIFVTLFYAAFPHTKANKHFPSSPVFLSLWFFVGELKLTVPNVAIQLWSRAVLQGCHDRINKNNTADSRSIRVTVERTENLILRENVSIQVNSNGDQHVTWTNLEVKKCQERKVLWKIQDKDIHFSEKMKQLAKNFGNTHENKSSWNHVTGG